MNSKIAVEDILLYVIIAGVFIYLGFYFVGISDDLNAQILSGRTKLKDYPATPEMIQIILRYDFGNNVLVSNSARINMSFMIGSVLAVLGGLIIVRRVKTEANKASGGNEHFKFDFSSNSPGLAVCALGVVIICLSIVYKDKYSMTDSNGNTDAFMNAITHRRSAGSGYPRGYS